MNKIFAVILAALLFVWAPVGAQNSNDVVFQKMTSEQEWPKVFESLMGSNLANTEVVSVDALCQLGYSASRYNKHPSGELSLAQYCEGLVQQNPALMPEKGVVRLETFLALARAGKLQHPPVTVTATNEAAPAPVAAAVPVVTTEEAVRRANIAIRRSTEAVDGMARLSVEVEKLASRSTATDPAVLRRLAALEKGLKEVPTTASLKALEGTVSGLKETFATQARLSAVELKVDGQGTSMDTMTEDLEKVRGEVDTLVNAPAKGDGFARLMTSGAIVLALLALIIGFIARGRSKEARRIADLANRSVSSVIEVQEIHQEDIKRLHRRTADMKDIFIHEALIKHLEKLSGNRKHRSVVRVDDEDYVLVFQLSADDKGMYRVFGIEGQHNAVSKKNMRSVILRAARDGRLNQKAGPASDFEEDEEDKVTPISAAVAVK